MIISTTNPQVGVLLAAVCLQLPDDSGWSTATADATQLDGLATVLWKKHRGEWRVRTDNPGPPIPYDELRSIIQLELKTGQTFFSAPEFIGAKGTDLAYFIQNVYRSPVTDDNYQRVAQLFRIWFAFVAPNKYHEPKWRSASSAGPWFNWRYPSPPSKARIAKKRMREDEVAKEFGWKSAGELLTAIGNREVIPPRKPEK